MTTAALGVAIRPMDDAEQDAVAALWDACGLTRPWNPPAWDIPFARANPSSEVLVAVTDNGRVVGSVLCGHDGHRGWLYYVAVHPDHRRTGLGRRMVEAGEQWLAAQGVWKVMLMVRDTNAAVQDFYRSLGYDRDPVTVMSRRVAPSPGGG
ncbi:GNAT family acetyltransferase [Caenispirillum bisanense]|uniref:Ribosomal protein S18 acetylase RimI n=1 Tax=Caenispirillum bisanense TaxID=414052 RepID=A0A286H1H1_9PROT|nr:GNAT family acetyltransferase [Caenispirillum bisanense]SOE01591.1 Ribosomal protein S18 acetylase RimI [Caenispirillum bisanense]